MSNSRNTDKAARDRIAWGRKILQQYTLEELEAQPELLTMIPEDRRADWLKERKKLQEQLDEIRALIRERQEQAQEALRLYNEAAADLDSLWIELEAQAREKYNLSEEEYASLMAAAPELHSMDLKDFRRQSMDDQGGLLIGGLLDTILKRAVKEVVQEIREALETPGTAVSKFLRDPAAFMVSPLPRGMDLFERINDAGQEMEFNGVKILFPERLGINEQKINGLLRISFAKTNYYAAKNGINTNVELPFLDTMKALKRKPTEDNKKKFRQRLMKELLPAVAHQSIQIRDKKGAWHHIEIGAGYWNVDRRNDRILFRVSNEYAAYLSAAPLTQYNSATFMLGDQNNPVPFYLAIKLQDHYFHDGNRVRNTHNILSVKTLLEFCADMIPSYDYIQEKDPGHWVREIKERLETALNEIQTEGLFKWEYCQKGMAPVDKKETQTRDYRKWIKLYITFTMIPEEPDQRARIEHKQQRIAEAKEKKAIKEAETIVKADKIQSRNRKKGTAQPVKGDS